MKSRKPKFFKDAGKGKDYAHFDVHFTGPYSEVESDLVTSAASGRDKWCNTFRDLHDGDLAWRAPTEMLKAFADSAPTELLKGYIIGILFTREKGHEGVCSKEWAFRASSLVDAGMRGAVLGQAFMAA